MIMLTSIGLNGSAEELASIGFCGFLAKPTRRDRLRGLMEAALRNDAQPLRADPHFRATDKSATRRGRILLAEDNITNQVVTTSILK